MIIFSRNLQKIIKSKFKVIINRIKLRKNWKIKFKIEDKTGSDGLRIKN